MAKTKKTPEEIAAMRAEVEAYDQARRDEAEAEVAAAMQPLDQLVQSVLTPEMKAQVQQAIEEPTVASPELQQLLGAIVRCIDVLPGTVEQTRSAAINRRLNPQSEEPAEEGAEAPAAPAD